jgi:hypothetical protein
MPDRQKQPLARLVPHLAALDVFQPHAGDRLLAEYVGEDEAGRISATVYGVNLLLISVMVSVLWRYAVREHLVRPDTTDADLAMLTKRLTPGLAGYLVMIALGLFCPYWPCSAT